MEETRGLWRGKREVFPCEWVEGLLTYTDFDTIQYAAEITVIRGIKCTNYSVNPETLGECTGKPDKNGKLAFEGDLIEDEFDVAIGVIRYGEYKQPFNDDKFTKHIGFYVDWIEGDDKKVLRVDLGYWLPLAKIIGNIHDNPNLLTPNKT